MGIHFRTKQSVEFAHPFQRNAEAAGRNNGAIWMERAA